VKTQLLDLTVGQEWAYRANAKQPLARVRVTKLGTRKPERAKVFFVDDHFEGREEWVPPLRLRVPWEQAGQWQAREDKFAAVEAASSSSYDTPEYWAASRVLAQLPEELIEMNYGRGGGYVVVADRERLLKFIDAEASLLADPVAFADDDGSYVAPWAVTERLALHVAPRFSACVLADVSREEDRHRRRAIYGEHHADWPGSGYCSPEVCAEIDRKWAPTHDLLRKWCGQHVVQQYDEVKALREEISKLVALIEHAISTLREAGHTRHAKKVALELADITQRPPEPLAVSR
jgi:hypothetical protein